MASLSSEQLMALCDRYWTGLTSGVRGVSHEEYAGACNALAECGPETREWARSLLDHPDYEARATGAFLLGNLARRDLLGDTRQAVATELARLSRRPIGDEPKEQEANDAALQALQEIGEAARRSTGRTPRPRVPQDVSPLLSPEFAPIGAAFGLLEAPLRFVADAARSWYAEIGHSKKLTPIREPFPGMIRRLQPRFGPGRMDCIWVSVATDRWKTAYFDNSFSGGDPFSPIVYLTQKMGCHGLIVRSGADIHEISLYGPKETDWLNLVWSVGTRSDDGKWSFERTGPIQPFEEVDEYTKRPVRLRFTREMLVRYCQALGAPVNPTALGPDALLDSYPQPAKGWRRWFTGT